MELFRSWYCSFNEEALKSVTEKPRDMELFRSWYCSFNRYSFLILYCISKKQEKNEIIHIHHFLYYNLLSIPFVGIFVLKHYTGNEWTYAQVEQFNSLCWDFCFETPICFFAFSAFPRLFQTPSRGDLRLSINCISLYKDNRKNKGFKSPSVSGKKHHIILILFSYWLVKLRIRFRFSLGVFPSSPNILRSLPV